MEEILEKGLQPNQHRGITRSEYELSPEINGVYVGKLVSYSAAYIAYSYIINSILKQPKFFPLLNIFLTTPQQLKTLHVPDLPQTLPIVLSIELKEDCLILADEDFVKDGKISADKEIPQQLLKRYPIGLD